VVQKYKVIADPCDWRDRYYNFARSTLREKVDLRSMASEVESQSDLGSCTAQAIVGAYELLLRRDHPTEFVELSRLFLYYNARVEEQTTEVDEGVYIRDALKALDHYGVCEERLWPYNTFKFKEQPPAECYQNAKQYRIQRYYRLVSKEDILDALSNNHPVVAGLVLYSNFDLISERDTVLHVPGDSESELGTHAVLFVGYDLAKQQVLVRNSFGSKWGDRGHFWLPFAYLDQDLTDAWVFDIKLAKNG
jgi:C1A family cysteine protease